tara:strand:+ start:838 stop:1044 length:207 start_codon:yes stop_codon:yes gene_type:complete
MNAHQVNQQNYTTEEFAAVIHGKPNSIRSRVCTTGTYYGIKPKKLPNGRLLWAAEDVLKMLEGEEGHK